jgi:hypothetical protein
MNEKIINIETELRQRLMEKFEDILKVCEYDELKQTINSIYDFPKIHLKLIEIEHDYVQFQDMYFELGKGPFSMSKFRKTNNVLCEMALRVLRSLIDDYTQLKKCYEDKCRNENRHHFGTEEQLECLRGSPLKAYLLARYFDKLMDGFEYRVSGYQRQQLKWVRKSL